METIAKIVSFVCLKLVSSGAVIFSFIGLSLVSIMEMFAGAALSFVEFLHYNFIYAAMAAGIILILVINLSAFPGGEEGKRGT